ncbi:ABC transporter ATP-binding protein, partial [Candidatus Entotheonella serta]
MLAAGLGLAVPWILKVVLDEGLSGQPRAYFFWFAGGLLLAVTLGRGLAIFGYQYLASALAYDMAYQLRNRLYDHIQHISFADHDQTRTGELMSRATADVEAVRLFFHFGLPAMVSLVFIGIGTVVAMAWLDLHFALVALLSVPFFVGLAMGIGALLRSLQSHVQACTAELSVALQESLAGIRVVKAFAREPQQMAHVDRVATRLYEAYLRVTHVQALNLPLLTLLLSLAIALTLYIGGQRVIDGSLPLGSLVAATGYLAQLAQPLRRLSWLTGMASRCHAGGARLFEVLDTDPQVHERPDAHVFRRVEGAVHVDRVGFQYTNGVPVLHDMSFRANPGTVTAFLGSTGSGKTTLAQLLPRFYDVSSGRITLDEIDIRDVSLASLRRQIGMVMQDTLLFSTTIRDNIAYGLGDVSMEAITAAAKAARAHDFILQFPDGYDTWVGERGVTLSG